MKVAVVGAGLAGLSAAHALQRAGATVAVLESERRAGGLIVTERRDSWVIEGGPDGFLASEPELPSLAKDLGIADHLIDQQARGASVWTGKEFRPLAQGAAAELLGITTRPEDLAAGFRSFAGGMGELVDAVVTSLGARLRLATGVAGLVPAGKGWRLAVTGGAAEEADAVVLALPAYGAARLLQTAGVWTARDLAEVVYQPGINVSLAYRADQVTRPLEGTGFVAAPETSGLLRACTYASRKFDGRAPDGHVLLRVFLASTDADPGATAHAALAPILGIKGEPLWARAFELSRGLPLYPHGHAEHVADVRRRLARLPGLAIAGAGYDGRGVSACVRSGTTAAGEILAGARERVSRAGTPLPA